MSKKFNQQEKQEIALKVSTKNSTSKKAKLEAQEKATIVNNKINTKRINFKEEEKDKEATIQTQQISQH